MRTRINGEVRERLHQLLLQRARALGLTPAAIELLTRSAALERWAQGDEIATDEAGAERTGLLVVGSARVLCTTPRGKRVGVCFVAPGQFVSGSWPGGSEPTHAEFRVIAHDPLGTIVALWPPRILVDVLGMLPPPQALQLVTDIWRTATQTVRQKCHLLGLCLRDRVLSALVTLAHDFGRPHPQGVRIELRLTHADLAASAVGSRANVTRALEELREHMLVAVDDHRLVVTHRGLSALDRGASDDDAPDDRAPARLWPAGAVAGP
jgi:hypothetical protein